MSYGNNLKDYASVCNAQRSYGNMENFEAVVFQGSKIDYKDDLCAMSMAVIYCDKLREFYADEPADLIGQLASDTKYRIERDGLREVSPESLEPGSCYSVSGIFAWSDDRDCEFFNIKWSKK